MSLGDLQRSGAAGRQPASIKAQIVPTSGPRDDPHGFGSSISLGISLLHLFLILLLSSAPAEFQR